LSALSEAIACADPLRVINNTVRRDGNQLLVKNERYDLDKAKRIFVIGAGKACAQMAQAMEIILNDKVTDGLVNILRGTGVKYQTHRIKLNEASHPLPDESGVAGSLRMEELVRQARRGDLVICLISGGGSALMPLPTEGLSLNDKVSVTKELLKAGASINELNAVRKHLSRIKGGWLAKSVSGAQVITLILSDVVGDPLDVIASGPTAPDRTTFKDAVSVLEKYDLWDEVPREIQKVLLHGKAGRIAETPKPDDEAFSRVRNYVLFNNEQACEMAAAYLRKHGVASEILSTTIEGEANQVGTVIGSIAREMAIWNRPIAKPAALVAGGETTVTVKGKGMGGRNQEVALGAALRLSTMRGAVVASVGTDGVDGPTDAAGAIVDGGTITRAEANRLDARRLLADNDSYHFFSKLGDLIMTGPSGTNVNDIAIIVALDTKS
jgi:glycerate 2-kinase